MKEAITADKSLYNAVAQRYYWLQSTKRNLLDDRTAIEARLHMIDEEMVALNDILCKHGKHLYEHFENATPALVEADKGETDGIK